MFLAACNFLFGWAIPIVSFVIGAYFIHSEHKHLLKEIENDFWPIG